MLSQIVLILALLLLLVGMIMVMLDAFSESFIWGFLVVLLPPIFVPIYSFVKWNKSQARNGFAMALVGIVMAGVGIYGGGLLSVPGISDNEIVNKLPTAKPKDKPLSNEKAAANVKLEDEEAYDPLLSTDKERFSSKEIVPLAPENDKTVKKFGKEKPHAINVSLDDITSSMGAVIEITLSSGEKRVGKLVKTTEDSISIEQQTSGGTVSYEFLLDKILSVVRLTKPTNTINPPVIKSHQEQ